MTDNNIPQTTEQTAVRRFARGARPTPRHKLLSIPPFKPLMAAPTQVAYVPQKLDMWFNDTYGICVTASECFAKACYNPEIFIDPNVELAWATQRGFRDGANLTDVMDAMQSDGFVMGSQKYDDGPYQGVDYSKEDVLQAAIATGPVKIGIDANALPGDAGNAQGWYAVGGSPGQFSNEDHCVELCGYGPAGWLYQQLNVPLPAGLTADKAGYLLFTWSTIGFVDHQWIMSTCGEAFVRNPTTVGVPPLPVPPTPPVPPGPAPTPGPNVVPITLNLPAMTLNGTITVQNGTLNWNI